MERYKDPNWLKEPSDQHWEDDKRREWFDSAQYYVNYVIKKELKIAEENFWPAYWLGKNLWNEGASEEEIREELEKYKASLHQ